MSRLSEKERFASLEQEAINSMPYLGSDEKNLNNKEPIILNAISGNVSNKASLSQDELALQVKEVRPWIHFVAGGLGGMVGAIATCPFDVVKTRLQSDVYRISYNQTIKSNNAIIKGAQHFKETFGILGNVYKVEGVRSLFKGLGPNLVGVIPARSINFFTYGLTKQFLSKNFNQNNEATWIHLVSAACAGITTSTATNPIWLIKTRLQLDKSKSGEAKQYKNSWDCLVKVVKNEGVGALYKGLTASYLGSCEGVIHWVLYEQMKSVLKKKSIQNSQDPNYVRSSWDDFNEWAARSGAAGCAKFCASMISYPHEVVRTRMRQAPMENGKLKYKGVFQSFGLIVKEEGLASMYGGLTPHLMRTVPNSIIMFGTWEILIRFLSDNF
ncbi:Rim2 protein [Saccharomycopsis crataegensis]|uniref:Rim2 protein n=1 Tax=Saccharomycopsis crataegensis TaxID=43959 RepID=A0AAV5QQJ6_9ASCO|nr:Rim2 protein [Saccharomycopsis crataegensis]